MRVAIPFLLFGLMVTLIACKEPEPDFIFFENKTNQTLTLTAHFHHEETNPEPLTLQLMPGQSDGWRYLEEGEEFDASFQSLSIASEECELHLDQFELKNRFRKAGAWTLRIDDRLIDCSRQK